MLHSYLCICIHNVVYILQLWPCCYLGCYHSMPILIQKKEVWCVCGRKLPHTVRHLPGNTIKNLKKLHFFLEKSESLSAKLKRTKCTIIDRTEYHCKS